MNKLHALGAGIALLASVPVDPAWGAVVINESDEINLLVFVPCANGGAGEVVELAGPLHTLVTFRFNGHQVGGKGHFQPQGISGKGLTTGDSYRAVGVTQSIFSGSLENGKFTETFVNNFRIIGQGRGNNFAIHENFHLTINANGEVTTFHDNFSADCK